MHLTRLYEDEVPPQPIPGPQSMRSMWFSLCFLFNLQLLWTLTNPQNKTCQIHFPSHFHSGLPRPDRHPFTCRSLPSSSPPSPLPTPTCQPQSMDTLQNASSLTSLPCLRASHHSPLFPMGLSPKSLVVQGSPGVKVPHIQKTGHPITSLGSQFYIPPCPSILRPAWVVMPGFCLWMYSFVSGSSFHEVVILESDPGSNVQLCSFGQVAQGCFLTWKTGITIIPTS